MKGRRGLRECLRRSIRRKAVRTAASCPTLYFIIFVRICQFIPPVFMNFPDAPVFMWDTMNMITGRQDISLIFLKSCIKTYNFFRFLHG